MLSITRYASQIKTHIELQQVPSKSFEQSEMQVKTYIELQQVRSKSFEQPNMPVKNIFGIATNSKF